MNKNHLHYEGYKFKEGSVRKVTDPLAIESPLEISINGTPFTVVMQSPGEELALGVGLLYAENIIKATTPFRYNCSFNEKSKLIEAINFEIEPELLQDGYLSSRSLLSVSSCGICGKQSLDDLPKQQGKIEKEGSIDWKILSKAIDSMKNSQELFNITGGTHAIGAYSETGQLIQISEDVGRHNAFDKVVGNLILKKKLRDISFICCSGRISFEIVSKLFRAKIPIVIAVSAPTSLAVDFAKEFGITLLAFGRNNKVTCYANPQRIH